MTCEQPEVADILKSFLLSSFRFRVFCTFLSANPVIRFLLRTESILMGVEGCGELFNFQTLFALVWVKPSAWVTACCFRKKLKRKSVLFSFFFFN